MTNRRRVQVAVQVIYLSQNRKTAHKTNHKNDIQSIDIYNKLLLIINFKSLLKIINHDMP
ncbi:hypothetical protein E3C21_07175 [Salmonella enterica subsp. enterica]|nr:hypothetical protein [Salmonella enterica subsp. enterica]EBL7903631.1 hypothetical protein [Salmonella enterica]